MSLIRKISKQIIQDGHIAYASDGPPIFQWLLNRPPGIRQKRTWLAISHYFILESKERRTKGLEYREYCKFKCMYGLYERGRMLGWPGGSDIKFIPVRGRHRFSFKRVNKEYEYPIHSQWYGLTALRSGSCPEKTDIFDIKESLAREFKKINWRTERGTKEGVELMEQMFGGLLVESPGIVSTSELAPQSEREIMGDRMHMGMGDSKTGKA